MRKIIFLIVFLLGIGLAYAADSGVRSDYHYNGSNFMVDGIEATDLSIHNDVPSDGDSVTLHGWNPQTAGSRDSEYDSAYSYTGSYSMLANWSKTSASRGQSLRILNSSFNGSWGVKWYDDGDAGEYPLIRVKKADNSVEIRIQLNSGVWKYDEGTLSDCNTPAPPHLTNDWNNITFSTNASNGNWNAYINGYLCTTFTKLPNEIPLIEFSSVANDGWYDDFWISSNHSRPQGSTPGTLSSFNCTSCLLPNGDNATPYTTMDTTPTFTFTSSGSVDCRISDTDQSYSDMGSSRDCTGGQGSTSHTCTLTSQDVLVNSTDYVYMACDDNAESGALEIELKDSDIMIVNGIHRSTIWPGATIYTNQQVYVRTIDNNQALATFDKVAVYKNQRWAFNFKPDEEESIGNFFNLSPIFYFLEMANISWSNVTDEVSKLINSTKT